VKRRAADHGSSDDSTDVEPDSDGGKTLTSSSTAAKNNSNGNTVRTSSSPGVAAVAKPTAAEVKLLAGDVDGFLEDHEEVTLTRTGKDVPWGVLLKQTKDGLAVDSVSPGSPAAAAPLLVPGESQ
jgi:hypothetical protein